MHHGEDLWSDHAHTPGLLSAIGVGAQSTFGGKTFLPENICMKIKKIPEFYMIYARKK